MSVSKNIIINKFKKLARLLERSESLSHKEALHKVALDNGFSSWLELKSSVNSSTHDMNLSRKKFYCHEQDSAESNEQIRGVYEGRIQFRESFIGLNQGDIKSVNALRIRLRSDIKDIIDRSTDHVCICITVFIAIHFDSKIFNHSGFFSGILSEFPQYIFINPVFRDEPLRAFHEEIPRFGDELLDELVRMAEESE